MVADIGTKALAPGIFDHLSDYLMGHKTIQQFLPFLQQHHVANMCRFRSIGVDRAAG